MEFSLSERREQIPILFATMRSKGAPKPKAVGQFPSKGIGDNFWLVRSYLGAPLDYRPVLLEVPLGVSSRTSRIRREIIPKSPRLEDSNEVSKPESIYSH